MTSTIKQISVIGLGTIGMRWATVFTHFGFDVCAQDPDAQAWNHYQHERGKLAKELQQLHPIHTQPGTIRFTTDIDVAVANADFIQENAPENLGLKRQLMQQIGHAAPAHALIASSSSAFAVSDFQAECPQAERIVLGHPFNPAHLMPLVEVVGGQHTRQETVDAAVQFYERIGKKPVVLQRELPGHLALRLMGAMWREAIALVLEGSVSVKDIDRAFQYGPGPKWTLQGSFISNALGAESMEDFLQKYSQTYHDIWQDLRATPDLHDINTRTAIIDGTQAAAQPQTRQEIQEARDAGLIELLGIQQKYNT